MINLTVGPVMSSPEVIEVANHSTPYFRTPEFSKIMLENEQLMLQYLDAPKASRCAFLTTSGTGGMEACVMNILNEQDKVLVINGGSFGQRFVELCALHKYHYTEVRCSFATQVTREQLWEHAGKGYTALLVNMDETSSGLLYDMPLIAEFCREQHILLIVDAISAFITDELSMSKLNVAAVIVGSQKALAVQPGVAAVTLAPEALQRIESNEEKCMYLSLKQALKNMERGQTPFTPAVTTLLQIHRRLQGIERDGGIAAERARAVKLTAYFRKGIAKYPFEMLIPEAQNRSNAVTALRVHGNRAREVVRILKDQYGIWVCPNAGETGDEVFRVGHIGYIVKENYDQLFEALDKMKADGDI